MNKTIYDEALEELKELEVILYYDVSKIKTALKQAQKQEELLNKIKEIIDRPDDSYIASMLEDDDSYIASMLEESKRYYDIYKLIKELENDNT